MGEMKDPFYVRHHDEMLAMRGNCYCDACSAFYNAEAKAAQEALKGRLKVR